MDICVVSHIIGNLMDDRFIRKIITCDEKWVYHHNPDATKQWLGAHKPAKASLKNRFGPKVMCICWNF